MPNWTKEQLASYESKSNRIENKGDIPCSQFQEQQDDRAPGKASVPDNGPKEARLDGAVCQPYDCSIIVYISDERDRDIDGISSTLLDCYLAAVGRLLQVDRVGLRNMAKSAERSGGR